METASEATRTPRRSRVAAITAAAVVLGAAGALFVFTRDQGPKIDWSPRDPSTQIEGPPEWPKDATFQEFALPELLGTGTVGSETFVPSTPTVTSDAPGDTVPPPPVPPEATVPQPVPAEQVVPLTCSALMGVQTQVSQYASMQVSEGVKAVLFNQVFATRDLLRVAPAELQPTAARLSDATETLAIDAQTASWDPAFLSSPDAAGRVKIVQDGVKELTAWAASNC
jgi:hypothetical protein